MRLNPKKSYLVALLAYVLLTLGQCSPASAVPLTWRDDPFSRLLSEGIRPDAGNTVTCWLRSQSFRWNDQRRMEPGFKLGHIMLNALFPPWAA